MNSLSNIDIEKICNQLNLKLNGVYSKDEIPKELPEGYYIINLEDHRDSRCGHWTVFYYSRGKSLYFDSFGFVPPKDIELIFSPDYIYNAKQIQDIESSACGFFCIAFVAYTSKSSFGRAPTRMDFQRFCGLFSKDTKLYDINLFQFFDSFCKS